MSSTRAEKFVVGILELFHNDTRHHDTTDKPALLKTLQEDFPKFLSACVSRGLACLGQGEALIYVWRGCGGRARGCGGRASPIWVLTYSRTLVLLFVFG